MASQVYGERGARGASVRLGGLALVCLAALTTACGGSDATHQALHSLQGDLARLRAENGALAERLEALEIRAGVHADAPALPGSHGPPSDAGQPPLEVVRLVPSGAPSAKSRPDEETAVLKSTPSGVVLDSVSREDRKELAKAELERAETLFSGKKYDAALVAYAGFVVRFPEDPRSSAATLRRGECYFHKGDHARAAEQLEAALSANPPPERSSEALAMLVKAYDALGDTAGSARARARLGGSPPKPSSTKKP